MFGSFSNPVSAYKSVSVDSRISTADPHMLIMLLFEGARVALREAKLRMNQGQVAEKGLLISKAIDIIGNGLKASLDMETGGDLAERLAALYDYMSDRLLLANLKNNPAILDEVDALLAEVESAWCEIGPKPDAQTAAA